MVMLLLPASRASSTYASCQNQSIGSVVLAHYQETVGVQAGGGAQDDAGGLIDGDAPSGDIAGCVREQAEDGVVAGFDHFVNGGEEGAQDGFAGVGSVGMDAQRSGIEAGREGRVVDVDSEPRDGGLVHQLHEDAGDFAAIEHEVIGPADVAGDAGGLGDGVDSGQAERESEQRPGLEDDGAVEAVSRLGVPLMAVAALARGLLIGDHDGAERFSGGGALGGIDGVEAEDAACHSCSRPSSRRKLMSTARAEWVMAPVETKSAPASA